MPPTDNTACTGAPRGVTAPLRGVTAPLPPSPPSSGCRSGCRSGLAGAHIAEQLCTSSHLQACWQRHVGEGPS